MSDSDIIELLATKACGWKVVPYSDGFATWYLTKFEYEDAPGEFYYMRENKQGFPCEWNPLESVSDAFEVMTALHVKGYWAYIDNEGCTENQPGEPPRKAQPKGTWRVQFSSRDWKHEAEAWDASLPRAIALAAAAALGHGRKE